MNYTQLSFWILFLFVFIVYWRVGHRRQNQLLLVVSYFFYGFWDYRFLFLILISTVVDYIGGLGVAGVRLPRRRLLGLAALVLGAAVVLCSRGFTSFSIPLATAAAIALYGVALPHLYRARNRRVWFLVLSMVANLAPLGYYMNSAFFTGSPHALLAALGVAHGDAPLLRILLPAGISFYTFQAMSYTIDIYRGAVEPTDDFADFALFVCFFPHLVAGPIMRAHTLLPQVTRPRTRRPGDFEEGLALVLIGLFKKVALSDNMATIANAIFYRLADGATDGMSGAEVLVGIYAFAFQIYGDFSGYSSIARGISKWLGFDLVVNFHLPYLAQSPSDFWRRWHISLSSWLRDYLYVPLGGNRHGRAREYGNLMLTMLLGGLWHGARWTFVGWGAYHGLILCLYRLLGIRDVSPRAHFGRWLVRVVVMFHLTCLGWLLFRADSFAAVTRAVALIGGHFVITTTALTAAALILFYGGVLFVIELVLDGEGRIRRLVDAPATMQGAVYGYLLSMTLFFHARRAYEFLYFQF